MQTDVTLSHFFADSVLFVDQLAFRAWMVEAQRRAALLQAPTAVEAAMAAFEGRERGPRLIGDVAVLDVCGPICYKAGWSGYYYGLASIEDLQTKFRTALADPAVKTILFRFDSPGGEVTMVPEFADELYAARALKPLIGVADTLVASAAYWLAAQLEVIYTPVSGRLGSIGVYTEHIDYSGMLAESGIAVTLISYGAHKTDGHPYAPLPDDVRARIQERVNEVGGEFDAAVARGRKVSKTDVAESFGQGEVFRGKQAMALGLADKLGTFSQVVARLTKNRGAAAGMTAADQAPTDVRADGQEDDEETPTQPCEMCAAHDACACTQPECEEDCPTCAPSCGCRKSTEEGRRAASTIAALLAAE